MSIQPQISTTKGNIATIFSEIVSTTTVRDNISVYLLSTNNEAIWVNGLDYLTPSTIRTIDHLNKQLTQQQLYLSQLRQSIR